MFFFLSLEKLQPANSIFANTTVHEQAVKVVKGASDIDTLVSLLDEASLDADRWREPFDHLVRMIDGAGFHFLGWDPALHVSPFSAVSGSWCEFIAGYHEGWGKIDPHMRATALAPVGQWLVSHQQFDKRFVSRSEYYQDFLLPNRVRHLMGTSLLRSGGIDVVAALGRSVGDAPFSVDDVGLIKRVTPHLQRAVKVHMRTAELRERVAMGEAALNAMDSGVFAVDRTGQIVFANKCAEAMLRSASVLRSRLGCLGATVADDDSALRAVVSRVSLSRAPQSLRVRSATGPAADSCAMTVIALPQVNKVQAAFNHPDLLVLVNNPTQRQACTAGDLMAVYAMTPAEARLAIGIASGLDLQGYAAQAQVSLTTVRAQLKTIFGKTGVRRQSELVRALGQLATSRVPPL